MSTTHLLCRQFIQGLVLLAVSAGAAFAQAGYPDRAITLTVPFAAGGTTDVVGRIIAKGITDVTGQSVIVDNKGGANGVIGTRELIRKKADGYNLLMGSSGSLSVGYAAWPHRTGYSPMKDLTPIMLVARVPLVLVVNDQVPVASYQEFIDLAKAQPGKLMVASAGPGSTNNLAATLLEKHTGIKLTHVNYKGTGPVMTDLLGNHVQAYFDQLSTAYPQIQAGKLKPLVVTANERSPMVPDIPTLEELGFKGIDVATYFAIMGPPKMAPGRVAEINQLLRKAVNLPATQQALDKLGISHFEDTPEQLGQYIKTDYELWRSLLGPNGIENSD